MTECKVSSTYHQHSSYTGLMQPNEINKRRPNRISEQYFK